MNTNDHAAPFTLERLLADDLPASERQSVETHLDECAACHDAFAALRRDNETFQAEVPYAAFRIEHEARKERRASKPQWLRGWLPSLATAAAVAGAALFVVVGGGGEPLTLDEPGTRIKGATTAVSFAVVEAGTARPGVAGEVLPAGAQLQLSYDAGELSHIGLLGIDGAGSVAVLFPEGSDRLAPLPSGKAGPLPFSLTLDATPGAERFIALFANEAALLRPLRAALEALAGEDPATLRPLQLPPGMEQSSLWIRKAN